MENPYRPGTLKYLLLDGNWSKLTPRQIAERTYYQPAAVRSALHQIYQETGHRVPHVDGRSQWYPPPQTAPKATGRPDNPFPPGTLAWHLCQYDWSKMDTLQIAAAFDTYPENILMAFRHIRKRTGVSIPYRRRGRWSKQQPSSGENT